MTNYKEPKPNVVPEKNPCSAKLTWFYKKKTLCPGSLFVQSLPKIFFSLQHFLFFFHFFFQILSLFIWFCRQVRAADIPQGVGERTLLFFVKRRMESQSPPPWSMMLSFMPWRSGFSLFLMEAKSGLNYKHPSKNMYMHIIVYTFFILWRLQNGRLPYIIFTTLPWSLGYRR
jgi:hypothetical protein